MQRFLLTLFAVALFGCGTVKAQTRSANTPRTPGTPARSSTMMPTMSPTVAPGTIPTVGATGNSLGIIFLYTGSLGPIPGNSLGGIVVCPTTGTTSSTTASGSSTAMTSGGVASSSFSSVTPNPSVSLTPPVAPLPITSPFGMSTIAGICSQTTTTTDAASQASSTDTTLTSSLVGSAAPMLAPSSTVATPNFSDATTPSAATAPGLSPQIAVPVPTLSTTTCPGISAMTESSSLAMPNSNIGAAMMPGLSSPSGC